MPFSITLNAWNLDAFSINARPPSGWTVSPQAGEIEVANGPAVDLNPHIVSITLSDTSNDAQLTSSSGDTIMVNGITHRIDAIYLSDSFTVDGQQYQIASFYYQNSALAVSLPLISGQYSEAFSGLLTSSTLAPAALPQGLPTSSIACFCRGTLIETDQGLLAIETLKVGDLVYTKDNGLQPIRWIGSTCVHPRLLFSNPQLQPIRIRRGALGQNIPAQDLLVSQQHRILLHSQLSQRMFGCREILVAATTLLPCDGVEIAADLTNVEYYHMLFDAHEIVLSNGAETESLYTGPEAMKALGDKARAEILELFPGLVDECCPPMPARLLPVGQSVKKLADRHARTQLPLVE